MTKKRKKQIMKHINHGPGHENNKRIASETMKKKKKQSLDVKRIELTSSFIFCGS